MRISNKTKILVSFFLVLVLGGILIFSGREAEKEKLEKKVSTEQVMKKLSTFFNTVEETERFGWQQSVREREERLLFSDFMSLSELFCRQGLLKRAALLELEQKLTSWQSTLKYPTEAELNEYYRLCAIYSERTDLLGRYDVFLFGEKGDVKSSGELITNRGTLYLEDGVKITQGFAYSLIIESNVITEVLGYANDRITLKNAWLISAEQTKMTIFYAGTTVTLYLEQPLSGSIRSVVADIMLETEYVVGLSVKQDVIRAKVLRTDKNCVELEGYGTLEFDENFKIYKIYEELEEEQTASILVGYTTTSFALNGDKISAALITEPIQATNIRVLIQNSSYQGYFHEYLNFTSESRFFVSDGAGQTVWYEPGETITITKELAEQNSGRIYLGTEREKGSIVVTNISRVIGNPAYRGTLEIAMLENQMVLINELSIEEYLYGVLPSEMPESFGVEALKAQAVCARSYAYNQLLANRFHQYGAHVDDSTSSQVYMNYGENDAATFAVKDTFGKIMSYQGECVKAYYFSCSYGHTSNSIDVWDDTEYEAYLSGKQQTVSGGEIDLSKESSFLSFFQADLNWYDDESVWFRWQTTLDQGMVDKILERLVSRYAKVPDKILTEQKDDTGLVDYVSLPIEPLGELLDLQIVERANSGIITKLKIVGSKRSYLICKEYNIRAILASTSAILLADGSTTSNSSLLPSAYFTLEKQGEVYIVIGGGYGHGVGMSQYGAKKMASTGSSYDTILSHFYPGISLLYLYQ